MNPEAKMWQAVAYSIARQCHMPDSCIKLHIEDARLRMKQESSLESPSLLRSK